MSPSFIRVKAEEDATPREAGRYRGRRAAQTWMTLRQLEYQKRLDRITCEKQAEFLSMATRWDQLTKLFEEYPDVTTLRVEPVGKQ